MCSKPRAVDLYKWSVVREIADEDGGSGAPLAALLGKPARAQRSKLVAVMVEQAFNGTRTWLALPVRCGTSPVSL